MLVSAYTYANRCQYHFPYILTYNHACIHTYIYECMHTYKYLLPSLLCAFSTISFSAGVHGPLQIFGSNWLNQRSRVCLADLGYVYVYVCMCVCGCICVCVCVCMCVRVDKYLNTYIHTYIHTYINTYIYTHTTPICV